MAKASVRIIQGHLEIVRPRATGIDSRYIQTPKKPGHISLKEGIGLR